VRETPPQSNAGRSGTICADTDIDISPIRPLVEGHRVRCTLNQTHFDARHCSGQDASAASHEAGVTALRGAFESTASHGRRLILS